MSSHGQSTIVWWVSWIFLTILTFFVAAYFWTWFIARYVGRMQDSGMPVLWVVAVFGTWMLMLVPLIVLMYNKVDKTYEDARIRRETESMTRLQKYAPYRGEFVEETKRRIGESLVAKLREYPEVLKRAHLVHARLRDGRRVENIFIYDKKEMLGVYDRERLDFDPSEIVDVEPVDIQNLPAYEEAKWLRLDGIGRAVTK